MQTIKNFEKWNENYIKKYDIEEYYKSSLIVRFIEEKRIKQIVNLIQTQEGDRIIELGCGAGHILEKIPWGNLTGVDISETLLKKAEKRLQKRNAVLIKGNIEDLPQAVKNKKFDKIICSEVLEHVQNPGKVIDEILKIAHKDSVIVISIPNEKLINRLKGIFLKLRIFFNLFPNSSKKMDEEWHLHSFNMNLLEKYTKGKLIIKKVKAVPFWFLPIRYVVKFKI
ncbi:MAG: methyltransferase domain-containing protein [Candidatus Parcubacteria bacterium]|nr:methyltransferase domain-containing protein [Candidatus Parcubacteria bacterium]